MDIVERLKRVKYTRERNDAPNGFSWDEPCDADDYGAEQRFVNPDGPEAADEIERLRKVLQEIADKDGWCSAKAVAKRLREAGYVDINTIYKMAEEAADEIERLREELKNPVCDCPYLDDVIKKDDKIERLLEALRRISLLPCEWNVHEIAVAALKDGE
jgi:hypothetical protein